MNNQYFTNFESMSINADQFKSEPGKPLILTNILLMRGNRSYNGWEFHEALVNDMKQVPSKFEGPSFIDHQSHEELLNSKVSGQLRTLDKLAGTIKNVRYNMESKELRGDLEVAPGKNEIVKYIAENSKTLKMGFSAHWAGKVKGGKESKKTVTEFLDIKSTDLVFLPSHGGGVYESQKGTMNMEVSWQDITLEGLETKRPDLIVKLQSAARTGYIETTKFEALQTEAEALKGKVADAARVAAMKAYATTKNIKKEDTFFETLLPIKEEASWKLVIDGLKAETPERGGKPNTAANGMESKNEQGGEKPKPVIPKRSMIS